MEDIRSEEEILSIYFEETNEEVADDLICTHTYD